MKLTDKITYIHKLNIRNGYRIHYQVWYKNQRIGSVNSFDITEPWSFLSYPDSETEFESKAFDSLKKKIRKYAVNERNQS